MTERDVDRSAELMQDAFREADERFKNDPARLRLVKSLIAQTHQAIKEMVFIGAVTEDSTRTVLQVTNGNIAEAARHAGVDRKTFYKRCKRLGINVEEERQKCKAAC